MMVKKIVRFGAVMIESSRMPELDWRKASMQQIDCRYDDVFTIHVCERIHDERMKIRA